MANINNIYSGAAIVDIIADNSKLKASLDNAQNLFEKLFDGIKAMGPKLSTIGQYMLAPFQAATRTFAAFDDQMRMVQAVTSASGEAFASMTAKAKELGATTAFTAAQVAGGMGALGRMGFNPDEINAAIKPMMALSQATGTEVSLAAQIAANNLKIFRMNASESGKVADILAFTANNSAMTLEDLGESLKTAAPVAQMAGANLREVAAAAGVLANMGIRGSLAGTALAKSYKQMTNPKVQEFLGNMGIKVTDASGNLRNMAMILADVGRALAALPNAQRIAALEEIFDARGALGGGILSFNVDGLNDFMERLGEADGYATKTADTMEAGLGGALRLVGSAFEAVQNSIGAAIQGALIPLLTAVADVSRWFASLISSCPVLTTAVAIMAAGVTAVGVAFSSLAVVIGTYGAVKRTILSMFSQTTTAATAEASAISVNAAAHEAASATTINETAARTANIGVTTASTAATAADTAVTVTATAADGALTVAEEAETAATAANTTITVAATGATGAYTVATGTATAATGAFTTALHALKAAMIAHPAIAIISGIALAVGALGMTMSSASDAIIDSMQNTTQAMEDAMDLRRQELDLKAKGEQADLKAIRNLVELQKNTRLVNEQRETLLKLQQQLNGAGAGKLIHTDASGKFTIDHNADEKLKAAQDSRERKMLMERIRQRGQRMTDLQGDAETNDKGFWASIFNRRGQKDLYDESAREIADLAAKNANDLKRLKELNRERKTEIKTTVSQQQAGLLGQYSANEIDKSRQQLDKLNDSYREFNRLTMKRKADNDKNAEADHIAGLQILGSQHVNLVNEQNDLESLGRLTEAYKKLRQARLEAGGDVYQRSDDIDMAEKAIDERRRKLIADNNSRIDWTDTAADAVVLANKAASAQLDRELGILKQNDPSAYRNQVADIMARYKAAYEKAAEELNKTRQKITSSGSDGKEMVTDSERKEYAGVQKSYKDALSNYSRWNELLASIDAMPEDIANAQRTVSVSNSLSALARQFEGDVKCAEETLMTNKNMLDVTTKIKDLVSQLAKGGVLT